MKRKNGFTLVEMLVVVIIIAVLASMVLGLGELAKRSNAKTITLERLGRLRAAVEEFNAEYGKYPPVFDYADEGQPFGYEYPLTNKMSLICLRNYYILEGRKEWGPASAGKGKLFTFGLMAYLVPRYADHAQKADGAEYNWLFFGPQWELFNVARPGTGYPPDQPKDLDAINRWRVQIESIISTKEKEREVGSRSEALRTTFHTNEVTTVVDGWNREFNYQSRPPYLTYKIWSNGPDGASGNTDDISINGGM